MSNSNELYEKIEAAFENFQENHKKFDSKGNKAAGARARKSLGEIKKMVTEYRKSSVEESKS